MPLYNVPLQGGGAMQVDASDPQSAADNVRAQGGTPDSGTSLLAPSGGSAGTGLSGGGASGGGGGGGGGGGDTYANLTASADIMNRAEQAANQAYLNSKLSLDSDTLAFQKAQQAWTQAYQQGQLDLQNRSQDWQQQYQQGQLNQGQQSLDQSRTTSQNNTAVSLLQLASNLRGPQNYFQYLNTLGQTPQGLRDVVSSLAGQYNMPSSAGATPGATYTPASVSGLVGDITGGAGAAGTAGMARTNPNDPAQIAAGQQAAAAQLAAGGGGSATPVTGSQADANAALASVASSSGTLLPSGNQWNAQQYQRIQANPTAAGLLKSLYDASGRDYAQEQANFQASLPQYAFRGASGRAINPGM